MSGQEDIYIEIKVVGNGHYEYHLPAYGQVKTDDITARARAILQMDGWIANPKNVVRVDDWHVEFVFPEGTERIVDPYQVRARRKPKPKPDPSGAD